MPILNVFLKKYIQKKYNFVPILFFFSIPAFAIVHGNFDGTNHPNVGCLDVQYKDSNNNWVRHGYCSTVWLAYHDNNKYVFLGAAHSIPFRQQSLNTNNLRLGICLEPVCNKNEDFIFSEQAISITHPSYNHFQPTNSNGHDIAALIIPSTAVETKYHNLSDIITPDASGLLIDNILQDCKTSSECVTRHDIQLVNVGYGNTNYFVNKPKEGGADAPNDASTFPRDTRMTANPAGFKKLDYVKNPDERQIVYSNIYALDESGTRPGDSGSPVFLLDNSGNEIQAVGVLWGSSSGSTPGVSIATDLSVTSVMNFVQCIKNSGSTSGDTYQEVLDDVKQCGQLLNVAP